MRMILTAVALLAGTGNLLAATIAPGDVATAPGAYCCCITCPPDPPAHLFDNNAQLKQTLPPYRAVAFGANGHLFGADALHIVEYDTLLSIVRTMAAPPNASRLLIAQNGDIYVMSVTVAFGNPPSTLTILSPAGAVKQTFTLPFSNGFPTSFDLASDQCTLLYIDKDLMGRRFNVCTGQPATDLAPGPWVTLRATSDGGYIASGRDASTIFIFDAGDQLLKATHAQVGGTILSLIFDADPRFVWAGFATSLAKVRLATGEVVASTNVDGGASIAVNGEERPAAAQFAGGIPALSPLLLAALGCGLIALAWLRLR